MTAPSGDKTTGEVVGPLVADWITIALIRTASENLERLQKRTGLSKTDIANRAIILYEFIDGHLREGREVLIHDKRTRETHPIRIL